MLYELNLLVKFYPFRQNCKSRWTKHCDTIKWLFETEFTINLLDYLASLIIEYPHTT